MTNYQSHQFDLVIVGAGGAGLRAAIEAAKNKGLKIAILCKSLLGKAHTVMAEGGMAGSLNNMEGQDNWEVHFRDTMKGGKGLSDWRMVEIHAKEAPERIRELEEWGAVFDRTQEGLIHQRPFGGHSFARLAHVGDRTGLELLRTLQDKAIHEDVEVFMEFTVIKLFKDEDGLTGCLAYDRNSGEFHHFDTRALVLATGGCGKCFAVQTNSWEGTGDGHALAYELGAEMMDMEFMQFHPTGMIWPLSVKGVLVTEGVRGEGGVLRNSEGERFMFNYIPEAFKNDVADNEEEANRWVAGDRLNNRKPPELLTRDVVAKAINSEVAAGRGSKHGGAYLDIGSQRSAKDIHKALPSMVHQFEKLADVDITKEPMEVGPTAHYIMGGIRVNPETCESTVPGLFAAGEVASGLHGANRLGGNSLSDLLVFGKRAGEHAAKKAKQPAKNTPKKSIEDAIETSLKPMKNPGDENPFELAKALKEAMGKHCGIIREEAGIQKALNAIESIRKRSQNIGVEPGKTLNTAWHAALSLQSLLTVSEMLARSALERKESRGAHTRNDHPQTEKSFQKINFVLQKNSEGNMELKRENRLTLKPHLQSILDQLQ